MEREACNILFSKQLWCGMPSCGHTVFHACMSVSKELKKSNDECSEGLSLKKKIKKKIHCFHAAVTGSLFSNQIMQRPKLNYAQMFTKDCNGDKTLKQTLKSISFPQRNMWSVYLIHSK